jgi:hypothetical protein
MLHVTRDRDERSVPGRRRIAELGVRMAAERGQEEGEEERRPAQGETKTQRRVSGRMWGASREHGADDEGLS